MTTFHNLLRIVIVGTLLYLITNRGKTMTNLDKPMTNVEKLIALLLALMLVFLIILTIAAMSQ